MADADPKFPRSPAAARKASWHTGCNVYDLKGEVLDGIEDIGADRLDPHPGNPGSFLDFGGPSLSYRKRP